MPRTNSPHGSEFFASKETSLSPLPLPRSVFSERGNEDKSFLVKGKALGGRRGVVEATGELLLLGKSSRETFLSSSLQPPFLPVSTPAFSQRPSSYYVDPSDVVYFTSILRPLPISEGGETPFRYERIRFR